MSSVIDTLRDAIFGNPPVANFQPSRDGVLKAFSDFHDEVATSLANGTLGSSVSGRIFDTQALLFADLVHAANDFALVIFDADLAKNGLYKKLGASGTGSWEGPSDLFGAAASLAQAWAEGTEPGGAGTYSSMEWAESAPGVVGILAKKMARAVGTPAKPGVAIKATPNTWLTRVPVQNSSRFDDFQEFEFFNQAEALGVDIGWTLNGRRSRVAGVLIDAENFSIESMTNGGVTDTGLQPSTYPFEYVIGENGQTVDQFVGMGEGHAHMDYIQSSIYADGDTSIDYGNPVNAPVGTIVYFANTFTFEQIYNSKTLSAKIWSRVSINYIVDAVNKRLACDHTNDCGHVVVNCVPALTHNYIAMNPGRLHNVIKANGLNPVDASFRDGRQIGNLANGLQTQGTYGQKTVFAHSHTDYPTVQFEMLLGFGVPQRINDVDDNWTHALAGNTFTLCNDYGPKTYIHGYSNDAGVTVNVAGKRIRGLTYYQTRIGAAI